MKFITFITIIIFIIFTLNIPTQAQIPHCGSGTPARAEGLVTTPELSGIFSTSSGVCITNDPKASFVSFKIPSYADLKSIYYDQVRSNDKLIKEPSLSSLPSGGIKLEGRDHLFHFSSDLTITSPADISGNQTGIIFVDGNLFIGPLASNKLKHGGNSSGLVLVVSGQVSIDPTVLEIDAVIISSGRIYTAGLANAAGACSFSSVTTDNNQPIKALTVNGSLISLNDTKPIAFCRKIDNTNKPSEEIHHQSKYLVILRNIFSSTLQKWSEIP